MMLAGLVRERLGALCPTITAFGRLELEAGAGVL